MRRTLAVAALLLTGVGLTACANSDPSGIYFAATKATPKPVTAIVRPSTVPASLPPLSSAARAPMPNPAVTTGATATTDTGAVCAMDKRATAPVDPANAAVVFVEYGISSPAEQSKYKIDLLIPTQLGGANTVKNMWPMKITGAGYYEKQQLGVWLWSQVCRGNTPLDQAQSLIKQN